MLNFLNIIYDTNAYELVLRDQRASKLSHAYLFLSEDLNFLKSFCEEVSKLIINFDENELKEKNNLRIEKHIHPDVKFFGEEKTIDAKTVSEIIESADYSPFESRRKIFVLWNVDEMNEASQNKILKTIEEPPANTYFLLAGSKKNKLLPTILSRVKEVKLDKISNEKISKMLEEIGISKEYADIISTCSNGNATFAEKLSVEKGFINFYNSIVDMLNNLDGSKDVLKYSVMFNDKAINKNEFFDIILTILRDVNLIYTQNLDLIINKNILDKLKIIAKKLNVSAVLSLIEKCLKSKEMLAFNVSGTAVVDEFLFKVAEVKVKCRRL